MGAIALSPAAASASVDPPATGRRDASAPPTRGPHVKHVVAAQPGGGSAEATAGSSAPVSQPTIASATGIAPASPSEGGGVVGWGENTSGQLGSGFVNAYLTSPAPVPGLGGVKSVTAGFHFTLALMNDGTVLGWGGNDYGQLGDGQRLPRLTPTPVVGLSGVTSVAASGMHAIALLSSGTVATWGSNAFGLLGNGTTGKGSEELRYTSTVPIYVSGLSGVVAVAAGGADSAALLSNGTVMAWGENSTGQLGDGTQVEKDVPTLVRGLRNVKAIASAGTPRTEAISSRC